MKLITHLLKNGLVLSGLALFSYSTLIAQTTTDPSPHTLHKSKFSQEVQLALIEANNDLNESTALNINLISSYRIHDHITTGIGVGWQNYDQMDFMPVFAHITGNLEASGTTPYAFLDVGYAFAWLNEHPQFIEVVDVDGGIIFRTGLGVSFSGKGWAINLFGGYLYQKSVIEYEYMNGWEEDEDWITEERTRKRFTGGISFTILY